MDAEEFRQAGRQLVDWIADYCSGIADLPVMLRTEPGRVPVQGFR